MKQLLMVFAVGAFSQIVTAQTTMSDSLRIKKDSTLRAVIKADSVRIAKEYEDAARWENIDATLIRPVINAGRFSGVVPVNNITEVPDATITYKILFELTSNNSDSLAAEPNAGLVEVARVINLHAAAGIPVKKILPVVVVHAGALHALKTNDAYQKKYKVNNPNIELMKQLENIGTKFIACGQAMQFINVQASELQPEVTISLTAQTVITSYQLKGYVWRSLP